MFERASTRARSAMASSTLDLTHAGSETSRWAAVVGPMRPWAVGADAYVRLVVVSPHPDDETLGVGGLIAETALLGVPIVVLSITDGEAAKTEKTCLANRRQRELVDAMRCLVPCGSLRIVRCALPDGGVQRAMSQLIDMLASEIQPGDLVVAPLPCDGHSDHDAAGSATRLVAPPRGATYAFYPVWAWELHDPSQSVISTGGRRIDLSGHARHSKAKALTCFVSQTSGVSPVLPNHFLRQFDEPYEVLVTDELFTS